MPGTNVGQISVDLVLQFQSMQSQLKNAMNTATKTVDRGTSAMGSSFKKLGLLIGSAFAVSGLLRFGKSCVDLGSDLTEVQNVVDTVFTSMNEQVNTFAQNAADQFGLSETMAKRFTGTFGAMAKAFGFTESAAYEMSTTLTGLAGDVASFYNITQDEAYTKLKSVFSGETETLKDLGIVMTQAALDQFALAKGFGKATSAMTEQEKTALRYQFVLDKLGMASGDFAKTSDSWANQTRVLSLRFDQLKASLGQAFINILSPIVKWLNAILEGLNKAAKAFADFTGMIFGKANAGSEIADSAESAGSLADSVGSIGSAADSSSKKLKRMLLGMDEIHKLEGADDSAAVGSAGGSSMGSSGFGDSALPSDGGGTSGFISKIQEEFVKFQTWLGNFSPSFDAWNTAFSEVGKSWDQTKIRIQRGIASLQEGGFGKLGNYISNTFLPNVVNGFNTTFAPIFAQVMPVLLDEFGKDFEFVCQNINQVSEDILLPAFQFIETVATDVFRIIGETWDRYGAGILEKFIAFKESLREIWDNLYQTIIKPVCESIGKRISELWTDHLEPLWSKISGFFGAFIEAVLTVWNHVLAPFFNWLIQTFGPAISWLVDGIGIAVGGVVGVIADVIGAVFGVLENLMNFITGVFSGDWDRAWSSIGGAFENIWEGIKNVFQTVVDTILSFADKLFPGIRQWLTDTWNTICGFFGNVMSQIGSFFSGAASQVGSFFGGIWQWITDTWNTICNFFSGIIEAAKVPVALVLSLFDGLCRGIGEFFSGLWTGICEIWNTVCEWFVNNVISPVSQIFNDVCTAIGGFFSGLWDGICDIWDGVCDWFYNTVIKPVSDFFSGACDAIGGFFSGLWDDICGIWNGVAAWFDNNVIKPVGNFFIDMANGIIDGINSILRGLNNISVDVPDWVADLVGWQHGSKIGFNIGYLSRIPRLAQGGYLEANTPRLAIVGDNKREGEIIAPESKIAEAVAVGMSAVLSRIRQNPPEAGGNWVIQLVDTRGQVTSETVISSLQRKNTRDGRTVIPIGL